MKKQLLSIIFALLPMLAMADDSGSCGDNVTYTYNSTTKTLTIQGSGMMTNYNYTGSDIPWYSYKNDIKTVIIEEGVTSIGERAFRSCWSLSSITIPNSVVSIGYEAFYGCSGLQKVIVPDIAAWCGINFYYGSNPLYYAHHIYSDENTEIKDLVIPNTVTSIESYAFECCSGLTSVTIPNSVTSIGGWVFYGCSSLTFVNIPNSVTSIGISAFRGCTGLTSVTIGSGVTSIGVQSFIGCTGLTSITIPNSVTSIGVQSFMGCTGLTSITIPNSVTSIGNQAFRDCSGLTSVTIGNSVTSIGASAFSGCSGLTSVYSMIENVFTINYNTFDTNTYSNAKLYVPIGKKAVYKGTEAWKQFTNIEEYDYSTGIAAQQMGKDVKVVDAYLLNGLKRNGVQHGLNIIRMSDGTTRKVVVK